MKLLLDTHVVLWQLSGARHLGPEAELAIQHCDEACFSVVSFAEIGVKVAIGKLKVGPNLRTRVTDAGLRILELTPEHGLDVADLPLHHRDPFDRLLVAQARAEKLALVTADAQLVAYDVPIIDARA